jgi:adhesin/invasin
VTDTKQADGTTASSGVPTITQGTLATGDTATWTQTFDTAAVGTNKTLTPTGTVSHGATNVTSSYAITFVADTTGEITVGPASVTTSTVTAAPHHVNNDGVDTVTVTVQLVDAFGNLLSSSGGTVVIFSTRGSMGTVTDHDDGSYTATYTSDTTTGTVKFTAELDGTPLTDSDSINQS